jgi:hypothetical protein
LFKYGLLSPCLSGSTPAKLSSSIGIIGTLSSFLGLQEVPIVKLVIENEVLLSMSFCVIVKGASQVRVARSCSSGDFELFFG